MQSEIIEAEEAGELEPLSNEEAELFAELEHVISQELQGFFRFGYALKKIRDHRLYRFKWKTFADYCKKWDIDASYARHICIGVAVIENLKGLEILPTSERQTRELAKIKDVRKQREAWMEAVRFGGMRPQIKFVQQAVDRALGNTKEERADVRDGRGVRITNTELRKVFRNGVQEFQSMQRDLSLLIGRITTIATLDHGCWVDSDQIKKVLLAVKDHLDDNAPYSECTLCHSHREACEVCKGRGWLTKQQYAVNVRTEHE